MEEIGDSLLVGQDWKRDVRIVLFIQLAEGVELTEDLKQRLKASVRANASPRHVPAKIVAVPEAPIRST